MVHGLIPSDSGDTPKQHNSQQHENQYSQSAVFTQKSLGPNNHVFRSRFAAIIIATELRNHSAERYLSKYRFPERVPVDSLYALRLDDNISVRQIPVEFPRKAIFQSSAIPLSWGSRRNGPAKGMCDMQF
jgi:hypothetical protein